MILPRVYFRKLEGKNAQNSPWRVLIDRRAPYWRAILAQEVWESNHKRGALWRPLRLFRMLFRREEFDQDLEIMGHEVEVQAAAVFFGLGQAQYRAAEARAMAAHYPQFEGWPPERIVLWMEHQTRPARKWLGRWEKALRKVNP